MIEDLDYFHSLIFITPVYLLALANSSFREALIADVKEDYEAWTQALSEMQLLEKQDHLHFRITEPSFERTPSLRRFMNALGEYLAQ